MGDDIVVRAPARLEPKAAAIYERSAREALRAGVPDWIEDHDGTMWFPVEKRGDAMQHYSAETGEPFIRVRATREYMRIDLDAIADVAHDVAGDPNYDEGYLAYTWDGEGWIWQRCGKGDDRAVGFWRCELRRSPDHRKDPS